MTTPETLTPVGTALWHSFSTAWSGPLTYKYNPNPSQASFDSTNYAAYSLYYDSDGSIASNSHSIQVGITPGHVDFNTWLDLGSSVPDPPVENSDGTVSVFDGTTLLYKFTKPTAANASWLGGSPINTHSNSGSGAQKKVFCNFW